MYEINYTMFVVSSIILSFMKSNAGVMSMMPKSIVDVVQATLEEIVEAGREHFSEDLINLVNDLTMEGRGVFYLLDNYQELKAVHGDIVDEVIVQSSRYCCQYYRINSVALDILLGPEAINAVKMCAVSEDSSIEDHIRFIQAFRNTLIESVKKGVGLDVIYDMVTSGVNTMKNINDEKKEQVAPNAQQDQTTEQETVQVVEEVVATAADSLAAVVEHADVKVSQLSAPEGVMMLGKLNLLDPGGVLSRAYKQQKIQAEKDRLEKEILAKAKEKAKANSGKWYTMGLGKDAKARREALKKEIASAISAAHARVDAAYAA